MIESPMTNKVDYYDTVYSVLHFIGDKDILEIACFSGEMFHPIQKNKPRSHTAIEPYRRGFDKAVETAEEFGYDIDIHNIAYEDMSWDKTFDVVLCTGLLYHLHSPLHLIETLGNLNSEYIILEATGALGVDICSNSQYPGGQTGPTEIYVSKIEFGRETNNIPGNRQSVGKYVNCVARINKTVIVKAFDQLGYRLESVNDIYSSTQSKAEVCMMVFRRIENE